jgi:hypothetical protein
MAVTMKDPLLRNLPAILLGLVILFQLLILINVVSIKLSVAMETPCGDYQRPCKVIVVPDR